MKAIAFLHAPFVVFVYRRNQYVREVYVIEISHYEKGRQTGLLLPHDLIAEFLEK